MRLKQTWEADYRQWSQRDLTGKRHVYVWAAPGSGVHFNVHLEEDRTCILVRMGATPEGQKELIAVQDGYRASEHSWKHLLPGVKQRGPKYPKAAACLTKHRAELLRSTTSPPSTGSTSAPPTRSDRPSPPSAFGPLRPRAVAADSPR